MLERCGLVPSLYVQDASFTFRLFPVNAGKGHRHKHLARGSLHYHNRLQASSLRRHGQEIISKSLFLSGQGLIPVGRSPLLSPIPKHATELMRASSSKTRLQKVA